MLVFPFGQQVIAWQKRHGRHDLPWQRSRDPYTIWVSEIMLQQTQVATVVPYYLRFMQRFPDIRALAGAPVDDVMRLWSGLGYYSRARNLHRAAVLIVAQPGGRFPREQRAIAALPGVGRSTAAAIAALAFGERGAILDGNVKRVLCRYFAIDGDPGSAAVVRELWALAETLVPPQGVASYTQGLMDLGATVCVRSNPSCDRCPLADGCMALRLERTRELPAPRKRAQRPQRSVAMLLLCHRAQVLLEKRPATGIWGGLWSLPEAAAGEDPAPICAQRFGVQGLRITPLPPLSHGFTHFRLMIHPLRIEVESILPKGAEPGVVWLPLDAACGAALPVPVRRILQTQ